jgi:ATP-dependent RNA helicase DeaD
MSSETYTPENTSFSSFGLSDPMLKALERRGFTVPTSIQAIALPRLLADEGHLIVKARTGTGKTAAFGIPLIEYLSIKGQGHAPRAIILTPTRELALQVSREIESIRFDAGDIKAKPAQNLRITAVYGGASIRSQILDLKRGTEIVVGTPGRVMDLMERKILDLSAIDWFILDEADEMLDMGFFEDVETILAQVKPERRMALFSATMPEAILRLVKKFIGEVEILEDSNQADEKPAVDQYFVVLKKEDRLEALRRIIDRAEDFYGLIFCATKAGTDELARRLVEGSYPAEAIHGDLSQEARERTLRRFRSRLTTILVATDVAARGLDIERLTHVVNWDLPNDRDTYVHRIGRTARAGRRGIAVSLTLPGEQGRMLQLSRSMERIIGSGIERIKVPSVKKVLKSLKSRILNKLCSVNIEDIGEAEETSELSPEASSATEPVIAGLGKELIEKLGPEKAVEALLHLHYGEQLDPSRYGVVTDIPETPPQKGRLGKQNFSGSFRSGGKSFRSNSYAPNTRSAKHFSSSDDMDGPERVYVGTGKSHGSSARDIANYLMRAGGVPSRLIDAIEMKDYCAFATMPRDAARRACAFSKSAPDEPPIRFASPK